MLIEIITALGVATLTVGLCYATAHAIAYPIMRYREKKWEKERIERLKVYRQTKRDFVL